MKPGLVWHIGIRSLGLKLLRTLAVAVLVGGCVPHVPLDPGSTLPFNFSARPTWGEVRVVPALALHEPVEINLDSYLGSALPYRRQLVRKERTHQLMGLSKAVGLALPGEVNGVLGLSWAGQFRSHNLPAGSRSRVGEAVLGERPGIDAELGDAAESVGGEATLFCWISELSGEPLSLRGFPGEVLETEAGPVVLDHEDEPYLVTARLGMALVTSDGEVVVRYQDTFETILSGSSDEGRAGRELARAMAHEVGEMWAVDPRLREHEPGLQAHFRLR